MKVLLSLIVLFSSTICFAYPKTPRIWDSPGKLCNINDKDFSHLRYPEQFPYCRRNVSTKTKDEVCKSYGVNNRQDYTVDHIIPLSIGGSNHVENLWCQHKSINTSRLEFYYYQKILNGELRQAEAIHALFAWKFNPNGKDHIPNPPESVNLSLLNNNER